MVVIMDATLLNSLFWAKKRHLTNGVGLKASWIYVKSIKYSIVLVIQHVFVFF